MISAGELRHRVDVEALTGSTPDGQGNTLKTWAAVQTAVHAHVRPRSAREQFQGDRGVSLGSHEVRMRYMSGITSANRIKFGSRYFAINGVVNVDEENRVLVLDCTEGLT